MVLSFTSDMEKKYCLRKGVKSVPVYNTGEARITVNGNLLNEKESGGGGINVTLKFEISDDTLTIYYQNNKRTFKELLTDSFIRLTRFPVLIFLQA